MFRTRVKGTGMTVGRSKQPNFYKMAPSNVESRPEHLETSTHLAAIPLNLNSFLDCDTSTLISEDVFEESDRHSDESTHSGSYDTTSITSRDSSFTLRRPSLPSQLSGDCVEASPSDMCLLIPASRCMSPMFASKERHCDHLGGEMTFPDEFGDEMTFNGRHFHSLDPSLCRW
jgi:hypothetical protein